MRQCVTTRVCLRSLVTWHLGKLWHPEIDVNRKVCVDAAVSSPKYNTLHAVPSATVGMAACSVYLH